MEVIIMRGLPGSGKSTWVQNYCRAATPATYPLICSADEYFMKTKVYEFNPVLIGDAHDFCFQKFLNGLVYKPAYDVIIVDNTNTRAWEISPYYRHAELLKIPVRIVWVEADFETCVRRNTHGVPTATIRKMLLNLLMDELPPHWKVETVFGIDISE